MGGDRLEYPDDASLPPASLLESKLIFNSSISDARPVAIYMSYDLKVCFLENKMTRAEYTRISSKYFLPEIIARYHIDGIIAADGYVYIKIIKVMHGLKQAAIIAYNQLISHMDPNGYYSEPITTGIWEHKTIRTKCCLCVGDFGVKYFTKNDVNNLLDSLKKHYAISKYWEGRNYLGLAIDSNHIREYVDISMPEHVKKALDILQYLKTKRPQYTPHCCTVPTYGKILQMEPVKWFHWT